MSITHRCSCGEVVFLKTEIEMDLKRFLTTWLSGGFLWIFCQFESRGSQPFLGQGTEIDLKNS